MIASIRCRYCDAELSVRTGIYGSWYQCKPCDASIGCHPNTATPLGTMAQPPLRAARTRTHEVFDRLWKNGAMSRSHAYKLLRQALKLPKELCHIAMLEEDECARVIKWVHHQQRLNQSRKAK